MTKKIAAADEAPPAETPNDVAPKTNGQLYLLSALVQKDSSLKTLEGIISTKGKIAKAESLGSKTLAFPINKHRELTLVSIFFTAEPSDIPGLEKELAVEEEVERHLMTTWRGDMNREMTSVRPRRDRFRSEAEIEPKVKVAV